MIQFEQICIFPKLKIKHQRITIAYATELSLLDMTEFRFLILIYVIHTFTYF